jgi:hypothetical protein
MRYSFYLATGSGSYDDSVQLQRLKLPRDALNIRALYCTHYALSFLREATLSASATPKSFVYLDLDI